MSISIKKMGVINITPNSFSDGSLYNNPKHFRSHFEELSSWCDIIDIGAESTAPFNDPISSLEELERFESLLFPYVSSQKDPQITLSIDTYKPEVFYEVYLVLKAYWPKTKIIFNDISGCVDDELIDLLALGLNFDYVLCHNRCPSRDLASFHMKYIDHTHTDLAYDSMVNKLKNDLAVLEPFPHTILVDPCFGFSKTREQNHYLIKNFRNFMGNFLENSIVYGVSRKSFLRFPKNIDIGSEKNLKLLDNLQSILLKDVLYFNRDRTNSVVFRVHEPYSINAAKLAMDHFIQT